jgi:hypothetical protein
MSVPDMTGAIWRKCPTLITEDMEIYVMTAIRDVLLVN